MLVAQKPISSVVYANLSKHIELQQSLEDKVKTLVDLLTIRLKNNTIEQTAISLFEQMFSLRIHIMDWLAESDETTTDHLNEIAAQTSSNLQLAPYSKLHKAISKSLMAYSDIVSPMFKNVPNSFREIASQKPVDINISYDMFKALAAQPSPKIRFMKNWADASLSFEIALLLADLVTSGMVKMPKKRIETELIDFIYSSIERFGAAAIFLNFWEFKDEDYNVPIKNNMRILAGMHKADNGIYGKVVTTEQELRELILQ